MSLRKAIAAAPRYADAYNNLGNIYRDIGKTEAAIGAYRGAIEADPDTMAAVVRPV